MNTFIHRSFLHNLERCNDTAFALIACLFLNALPAAASEPVTSDGQSVPDSGGSEGQTKVVIITAQKKTEQLQKAPISVTALDANDIEHMGIESVADVARETPGLTVVNSGPGQNILIMRGIASTAGSAGTVGYYLDDTPISASSNAQLLSIRGLIDPSVFDIYQIEVLRGPQGTLYGSSSMGGTVKYLTKQPVFNQLQFEASPGLSRTQGGGWNESVSAVANVPLADDVAALRLLVFDNHADGYIDRYPINPHNYLAALNGPKQDNVNSENTTGFRAILKLKFDNDLTVTPSIFNQRTKLGAPFQIDEPPGSLTSLIQTRLVSEPTTQMNTLANIAVRKGYDDVELLSTTSYYDRNVNIEEDSSKAIFFYFSPPQTYVYPSYMKGDYVNKEFTQEFRLTSDYKGSWQFVTGAFYHHVNAPLSSDIPTPAGYNAAFGTHIDSFFYGGRQATVGETALFGESSYAITPALTARVGLRGFRIDQTFAQQGAGAFVGPTPSSVAGTSADNGVIPKFNLGWQVDSNLLLYTTASEGYRQGGPNNPAPAATCGAQVATLGLSQSELDKFAPDTLWNYELGEKAAFLNNTLLVDGSVYYIKWNKVQQQIDLNCGFNITANFGSATSKGVELEVEYQPTKKLNFRLTGNYTNAVLNNDVPGTPAKAGDELLYVPKWSGSASVEYNIMTPGGMPAFVRADYTYVGTSHSLYDTTSPFYDSKSYSVVNLRLGTKQLSQDSHWGASVYLDNAFNTIGQTSLPEAISADLPTTRRVGIDRPRTLGIIFKYQM